MNKQTPSGLFVPTKLKHVTVYFRGGGRLNVDCEDVEVHAFGGVLNEIEFTGCKSELPFFRYDAVDVVEVVT